MNYFNLRKFAANQESDPKHFTIDQVQDKNKVYETFKKSYEDNTGASWDANKFFSRANNWRFYGDEHGYVTVREQRSGMLKLTGVAGNTKSIMRGIKELMKEKQPIWGMVSKDILEMALRMGFRTPSPKDIKNNIHKIPAEVFGGAQITQIFDDGGVEFAYSDVGKTVKYLIGNDAYFSKLNYIKYTPKFVIDKAMQKGTKSWIDKLMGRG